jgi:DNA invertase Pin-like site-specific DNA recombinase
LSLFLERVEGGKVPEGSYLLIESMDRLSREDVQVALELFLSIIRRGIKIVTLTDQQEFSKDSLQDFTKLIMSIVLMARAHEESVQKSRRLAAAWKNKRDQAQSGERKLTAKSPAWLKLRSDRKKFEIIQDRGTIVARIFRETIDGFGAMTITRRLNEERIKPFGKASAWHISSVKKILNSESAFGRFQPHVLQVGKRIPAGAPIDDYYPAVVSASTFWKARQAISVRLRRGAGRKGKRLANLFSGIAFCVVCDAPMSLVDKGKPPKGGSYLQCYSARRHAGCPNKQLFRLNHVEPGILHLVATTTLPHPFNRIAKEQAAIVSRVEEIDGRIATIQKQLDRYSKLLGDDEQDFDDAIGEKVKQLRGEKDHLRAERKLLNRKQSAVAAMNDGGDDVHERLEHYQTYIAALNDSDAIYLERTRLAQRLRRLIRRIDFYGDAATVKFFDTGEEGSLLLNVNPPPAGVLTLGFGRADDDEPIFNDIK